MRLREIYAPIEKELIEVERALERSLKGTEHSRIHELTDYILKERGKRLRPALVLFSAKASQGKLPINHQSVISIAAGIELIHMASLIHDDVLDHSKLRHNRPTVNCRRGEEVAIALGGYLYATACELISACGNMDVIQCISSATKVMCEGELFQVCERDNLDLLKERYMLIVKKKTGHLFAASCQAGSLISSSQALMQSALKEYGLNFGIAFQIVDDYLDLMGDEQDLGKTPGQDMEVGEITLPLLNLLESAPGEGKEELKALLASKRDRESLRIIKSRLLNSEEALKTKEAASSFLDLAREKIMILTESPYRDGLFKLTDFIMKRGFDT